MAYRSRPSSPAKGSAINLKFLVGVVLLLAIGGGAAFIVRGHQVRRSAEKLRERAQACFDEKDFAGCHEWVSQYLQIRPDDGQARILLAQVADELATSFAAKSRTVQLYEQAIGFAEGDLQLRLRVRKSEMLLELERFKEAETDARALDELAKKGTTAKQDAAIAELT